MTLDEVKQILSDNNFQICSEKDMPKGRQIKLVNGGVVNVYNTGTVDPQGKEPAKSLLRSLFPAKNTEVPQPVTKVPFTPPKNVFIVYGHDEHTRNEWEACLRKWELNPIIFEQETSQGNTIIEKLFRLKETADFAVVLATPDDFRYENGHEDDKKPCVRQNVALELGMMLATFGAEKVAILLKDPDRIEKPSDINGLIYIPLNNASQARIDLAKEMNKQGFKIDIGKL